MTKREAKRLACRMSGVALHSFVESGWPFEGEEARSAGIVDEEGDPTADGERLAEALSEVAADLMRRGEGAFETEETS